MNCIADREGCQEGKRRDRDGEDEEVRGREQETQADTAAPPASVIRLVEPR